VARKTRKSVRQAARRRTNLTRTLLSTGLLAAAGLAVGLLVGVLWETPDLLLPMLGAPREELVFDGLEAPGGDTTAPADEQDATVPERAVAGPSPGRTATPPVAAPPPERGPFSVQVGSFTEPVPAWKLAEQLGEKRYEVYVDEGDAAGKPRWRVRIGPVATRREARGLADRLKAQEGLPTWILAQGGRG